MLRTELQIIRKLKISPLNLWEIINIQDGDIKGALQALNNLKIEGLIDYEGEKAIITSKGLEALEKEEIPSYINTRCGSCKGKGLVVASEFQGVLDDFSKIFLNRPKETAEFDQGVVPPENSLRRAEFLYERGDLEGREILLLGDDDLTSIVLSLTRLPKEVKVIEIDQRIVDYINEVAKEYKLNVSAETYNASDPLPGHLLRQFDVFLTDPVETVKGTLLFISRCAQGLKRKGSSGYFGLSHYESSLKKWYEIEKGLLNMNFVITDVLRDFNEYLLTGERILEEGFLVVKESPMKLNPPDYPWYRSTFFRIELIDNVVPFIEGEVKWDRTLYFDDDTFVVRP